MTDEVGEEAVEQTTDCPYECEECSATGRCDRCRLDVFVSDVTKIVMGSVPEGGAISETIVLAELDLLAQKAKKLTKEATENNAKMGKMGIEIDRLKADLLRERQKGEVGADIAIKASDALSKMQAAYGDDLSWDNVVERTTGALVRLQSQAPLLQAAEGELGRMRERLAALEAENAKLKGVDPPAGPIPPVPEFRTPPVPPFQAPPVPHLSPEGRLDALEQDMAFLRLISRLGGRLLGLDRPRRTR